MNHKKITHGAIVSMIVLALALTGCAAGIAGTSPSPGEQPDNPEESNRPSANPVETSVAASPNENQELTQPSADSIATKPGVYKIAYNTIYTLKIHDGVNASVCIKGTKNADGDECIALVVDGAENDAMEISEDKMDAYIIRNDNGNVGVLVSGEGDGDFKYNTYIYGFDGNQSVLKAGCGYETVSLTTKSIILQGTQDVFGTWVISNEGTLNDDFTIEYSNNGYFTVQSNTNDTKYLDTKMDIPVQMLEGCVYADAMLPAHSRIYPISFGTENNQICLVFETESGSTGRLFAEYGEHSYNISGIDEYDIFVDIPYK